MGEKVSAVSLFKKVCGDPHSVSCLRDLMQWKFLDNCVVQIIQGLKTSGAVVTGSYTLE